MPKRILLLTSTWGSESTKNVIDGILDRIGEEDIEIHIFNDYDSGRDSEYFVKGREIYSLPNPEHYDGMIVSLNTVGSIKHGLKYANDIAKTFRDCGKPVVGLDTHLDDSIFCGLDNYRSMYQIVDHMITIHDCRIFNYLGGPEDNGESIERYKAFRDCLEAHGLRVEKKRVLHMNFWKSDGKEAYDEWKERGVNLADALVCANDYMALGFVNEAIKDGIAIPDYMKVTGFDNVDEAQKYSPSITSVNRNWKMLGYESMDALLEAVDGNTEFDTRFVEGFVSYNESCGCDLTRDVRADYNSYLEGTRRGLETDLKHSYARQELFKSHSKEDFRKALAKCKEVLGFGDLAICLNESFFDGEPDKPKEGYDDKMIMITDEESVTADRNKRLHPEKWDQKEKVFLFSSLRNSVQTYGYLVMPYREEYLNEYRHRIFVESLSMALVVISNRIAFDKFKGIDIFK